ncbi:MAG: excisionase [Phenylobacterium zucineum]|nr:MAG: excisionase [Phenylobacterium zucineum]
MPEQIQPIAYSIKDACRLSSLARSTLYRAIASGALKVTKVGGRTLVPAHALRRLGTGEG